MRLIEAEERENEEEEKRKQSSTELKDQLFTRRTKQNTSRKHSRDSDPDARKPDEKRMRVTPPEQSNGASEDESEDEEVGCDNCC